LSAGGTRSGLTAEPVEVFEDVGDEIPMLCVVR
jgi:hypothetical protein